MKKLLLILLMFLSLSPLIAQDTTRAKSFGFRDKIFFEVIRGRRPSAPITGVMAIAVDSVNNSIDFIINGRVVLRIDSTKSNIAGSCIKKSIVLSGSAVNDSSAEVFTTNSGKLLTMEAGSAFPSFTAVPGVVIVPLQDIDVRIVRGSAALDVNGNLTFAAYLGSTGTPPEDGIIRFDLILYQY